LVIFDLFGQASFAPSSASRFCSGLAQGIADARVHAARLPYLRLILPPRALLSLYVAANASVVKSFSTGKPRNPLSLLWSSGRRRSDAVSCVDEMAVGDAGLVSDQSQVPVSPPDDATDGLLAEPSVFSRHGTEDLPGPTPMLVKRGPYPTSLGMPSASVSGWMIIFARRLSMTTMIPTIKVHNTTS